ncbi:ABC transporter substrate-binding protein [Rhodococcus sp. OK302]|uniref:ABC transporter substrate-binding protein n=1 Tax=Rhodococcus sp. OK302 TaxID=1882769 RepID=UPI000B93BAA9|nr:ABC transporter substrate-binding protein [Rhodococcus sp. OK302]OYD61466.1 ABC-type nitrate/sulfonate/bicarbonate transport system substrate-binding protein [Rhodococcus sp. OK302]
MLDTDTSQIDHPRTGLRNPRSGARLLKLGVAATALALVLSGCGGTGDPSAQTAQPTPEAFAVTGDPLAPNPLPEKTTIVVGVGKQLEVYAQYMMALAEGEFAKENLVVETQDVLESDKLALLSQGRMDLGYNAMTAGLLNLMATGAGIKVAFPGAAYAPVSKQGYWFNKDAFGADGPQASELKGKTILTPSGNASISAYYLWQWAHKNDPSLQLSDLKFQVMKPNEIALAMSNGAADVAQVTSPGSAMLDKDPCCVFVDTDFPSYTLVGWVGSEKFLNEKPDVAMAFFRAIARTQRSYLQGDYHANPDVAAKLADQMGITTDRIKELPNLLFDSNFGLGEKNLEAQAYWRELGLLTYPTDMTADQVYDTRYVDVLGGSTS